MRRGCDRIRVGSIAAKLSVLLALAAVHQTSAPNPLKLKWSKKVRHGLGYGEGRNTGTSSAAKISSAEGSGGKRCEMSPEEFAKFILR
jgi:hypothetical protein